MTGMAPDRQLSAERWTRGPGRGEADNTLQTTYSNTVHTFTIQPGPAFSKCCPNARFPLSTRVHEMSVSFDETLLELRSVLPC